MQPPINYCNYISPFRGPIQNSSSMNQDPGHGNTKGHIQNNNYVPIVLFSSRVILHCNLTTGPPVCGRFTEVIFYRVGSSLAVPLFNDIKELVYSGCIQIYFAFTEACLLTLVLSFSHVVYFTLHHWRLQYKLIC